MQIVLSIKVFFSACALRFQDKRDQCTVNARELKSKLMAVENSSATMQTQIKDISDENRQLQDIMNITDHGKLEEAKCVQRMAAWTREAHLKLSESEVGLDIPFSWL